MKPLVVVILAISCLAYAALANDDIFDDDTEFEIITDEDDFESPIAPQFIVSWQARRKIRKLQKQMPCGWPQYGIPPLAPLKVKEADVSLKKSILESFDHVQRFRVDGLDNFKIKKFKLNVITSKVTFDFLFKSIKASATKYETNTILDAISQLGLSVQYEGDGSLEFGLTNLRITGTLKYKIPILWGSTRITSLKAKVTLEKCDSHITGLVGNGAVNSLINSKIEELIESSINDNQDLISQKIEETVVPKVNKALKGNDFWTLIDSIFSSSDGESEDDPIVVNCVAPSDPWA